MKLKIFQADAFAEKLFEGNPAAVIPLAEWLPDEILQNIAAENNLSETAFFVDEPEGLHIRWFTPAAEVNLCGHATLASAHVLFNHLNYPGKCIRFRSRSGLLKVEKEGSLLMLDFPVSPILRVDIPQEIAKTLNAEPAECWRGRDDLMLVFGHETPVRNLIPDFNAISKLDCRGLIVTAPGAEVDFVSRFFAPGVGINEDPVTGSAHTILIPYWANRLGKTSLSARQVSKRGGNLTCRLAGERVIIGGKAVTFFEGEITL